MIKDKRFGVALSGGGYRAAAFHLGALRKLNDLKLLDKVDVLSTISGGSITGAAYCLRKGGYKDFEENIVKALSTKSVIQFILTSWTFIRFIIPVLLLLVLCLILVFTKWAPFILPVLIIAFYIIFTYQFKLFPISKVIEKAYAKFFYNNAALSSLCTQPELAIGTTNLQTGRQFTFSKRKMEDSAYAYLNPPVKFDGTNFPIARAVVASSCVPFAFSPVSIDKSFFVNQEQYGKVDPQLIDGGVYDNQGIHKITQNNSSYSCHIVLVSDAGNKLPLAGLYNNTITLLLRTVELFMGRIKNVQMIQNIYQSNSTREVAYQSLGWDLDGCIPGFVDNLVSKNINAAIIAAHNIPADWANAPKTHKAEIEDLLKAKCNWAAIKINDLTKEKVEAIRNIGTNLTTINSGLIQDMITHAGSLTELQLRLYCPSLF
jgi:NTE family protein